MDREDRFQQVRKRNMTAFFLDSFFFNVANMTFSPATVLPSFVAKLTDNNLYISLLTTLYYGLSYLAALFSCLLGSRARSPKKVYFFTALFQRVAFLLMFLSALTVGKWSAGSSLLFFMCAFAAFSATYGMTGTLFSQLVPFSLTGNLGQFYGNYMAIANFAGVVASLVLTFCFNRFAFPADYAVTFLFGTLTAFLSSAAVWFGIHEITDGYEPEPITLKEFVPKSAAILKDEHAFVHVAVAYMMLSAAEFSRSYYIVKLSRLPGVPDDIVGIMNLVLLAAAIFGSRLIGKLIYRFGTYAGLITCFVTGTVASVLAYFLSDLPLGIVLFLFSAVTGCCYFSFQNMISTVFSRGKEITLYSVVLKYIAAPMTILVPILGGTVANRFGEDTVFLIGLAIYLLGLIHCLRYRKEEDSFK